MHFARYHAEIPDDRQVFINTVQSFEKELPFPDSSDLVRNWEYLYERSLGCIGILKQWLVRAATVALHEGSQKLATCSLESQALCMAQCEQLYAEIANGELKLEDRSDAVVRFRDKLGLSANGPLKASSPPVPRYHFRRPGQRLPARDTVGRVSVNAAL